MKKGLNKGFTLIELLVVIAIIGILSGIVLTSLNTARSKAADTKIKAQLAGMRAQAEMYYDGASNYTAVCTGTNGLKTLLDATTGSDCNSVAEAWAADAPLSGSSRYYCVDSTGVAKETSSRLGDATACSS